jgi:hypothetical protein
MNIDMIVMFTLAALVTTVVVNSVNSIVNGTDAIIKTAMENVCIVSNVTATMTNAVTIDAMIVTVTVTVIVTVTVTVILHETVVAVSHAVHHEDRQLKVVTTASRLAVEAAVMNDHHMVTHAIDMMVVTGQNDIGVTITTAIARVLRVSILTNKVILVRNDQVHLHRLATAR